jgi:hypothetical protein
VGVVDLFLPGRGSEPVAVERHPEGSQAPRLTLEFLANKRASRTTAKDERRRDPGHAAHTGRPKRSRRLARMRLLPQRLGDGVVADGAEAMVFDDFTYRVGVFAADHQAR